jgi:pimeloyl-ACP methyl ester carboxylesterase
MNHRFAAFLIALVTATTAVAAETETGYRGKVAVTALTRLDWVFALANQSPPKPPEEWLKEYDSTEQTYELFVPEDYTQKRPWPVVIFVSPGDKAIGFRSWKPVCERLGIIFAGPHGAGNNCEPTKRVHIVLDVLDDVRRRFSTDVDRTYIAGFSGGGRIACSIGFSLPEHFGGVIPICAAGELREESWLRQRVIERLSVALVSGEGDFNRGEVERFRGPLLRDVGVRTRWWVVPKLGHGMPGADSLIEVVNWLDEKAQERRSLAKTYPAIRIAGDQAPTRAEYAGQLLSEGKARISVRKSLYSGLMLLKGVYTRWPDLPQAGEARKILLKYDEDPKSDWQEEDVAQQRLFLIARARAVDAYASGDLAKPYEKQRPAMAWAAINLWQQVIEDGQDRTAAAEGNKRIPELQKLVAPPESAEESR